MQRPDEQPQICERCNKQPATERYAWRYTCADRSEALCKTCFDHRAVRDAYWSMGRHVSHLHTREQYEEELACLDDLLEANRHLDHEKWLTRTVTTERANIF